MELNSSGGFWETVKLLLKVDYHYYLKLHPKSTESECEFLTVSPSDKVYRVLEQKMSQS